MVPKQLQLLARHIAEGLVRPLARRGVDPNSVTVAGFAFNIITAGVLATGHLSAGGALLFLSGLFDLLDGALARVTKRQSTFGAFLDSLLDRYSEALVLLALLFVFSTRGLTVPVLLVYAVAVGSILISYSRARAEGLGLDGSVGMAPRPERVIILGLGLLFNVYTTVIALSILALLTHATALQRLYHVWRQTHAKDGEPRARRAKATETTPT